MIEGERFTITPSEGKEKSSDLLGLDRTLSLIDAFLAGQPEEEQKDITQLPMDITTDYTSYLLTETEEAVPVEEIPSLKGQDLIDTFLENNTAGRKRAGTGRRELFYRDIGKNIR